MVKEKRQMSKKRKWLIGGLAFSLLFSQGLSTADAKGKGKKTSKKVTKVDKNKDGIDDKWAAKYKLGTSKGLAKKDKDKDGLSNLIEYKLNLNPADTDSDNDKIGDGDEDTDKDGVTNEAEVELKLNPADSDSDNDKIKDGTEDANKDGISIKNEVNKFKLKVRTTNKKEIEIEYKSLYSKRAIKIKDKTGIVTKEVVDTLVNELNYSKGLTKETVLAKVVELLQLDDAVEIKFEVKYFNGKGYEIEKEIKRHDEDEEGNEQLEDDDHEDVDQDEFEDEHEDEGENGQQEDYEDQDN